MADPSKSWSNFQVLRNRGHLIDVTLVIEEKKIPAHRLVLSACSPYFNAMFNSNLETSDVIFMKDLNSEAVETIIDSFYKSSNFNLNNETVDNVLQAACYLHVDNIKELCCSYLKDNLDSNHCWSVRSLAGIYSCEDLKRYVDAFIRVHFSDFVNSEDFLLLSIDSLESIVGHDNLFIPSERVVYDAVMRWINYEVPERSRYLSRIMAKVRLPLLGFEHLDNVLGVESIIRKDNACVALVENAKRQIQEKTSVELKRSFARQAEMVFADVFEQCFVIGKTVYKKLPGDLSDSSTPAYLNGKIYFTQDNDSDNYTDIILDLVLKPYDLLANKCLPAIVSPLKQRVKPYKMIPCRGELYIFSTDLGGSDECTGVQRYNPKENTWMLAEPLGEVFDCMSIIVTTNDYIYAFATNDALHEDGDRRNKISKYDPNANTWSAITPLRMQRLGMAVGVFEGEIYVVGGFGGEDEDAITSGEKYNPKTDSWSLIADLTPPGLCSTQLAVVNRQLYALGGQCKQTYYETVQIYDKTLDTWTITSDLQVPFDEEKVALINVITVPEPIDFDDFEMSVYRPIDDIFDVESVIYVDSDDTLD